MLEACWGLEAGVAPDDLDNVAEHKDKGHAADEVADEGAVSAPAAMPPTAAMA